jgi:hypothetical protein
VHPFFDELRDPNCRLPNGRPLPPLFNFKPQGNSLSSYFSSVVSFALSNLNLAQAAAWRVFGLKLS